MAKETKYSYYKLNTGSTLFHDPKSGLIIRNREVTRIEAGRAESSERVQQAITTGHVQLATEEEFEKWEQGIPPVETPTENKSLAPGNEGEDEDEDDEEEEDEDDDTEGMTKAELIDEIKENENVPDEEKKGLTNKNREELIRLYKKYK